jgi:hypothetical protein
VLEDVQTFARRRPGVFLLGAAVLGFGVGRYVKAEAAQRKEQKELEEQEASQAALPVARRRAITSRTVR